MAGDSASSRDGAVAAVGEVVAGVVNTVVARAGLAVDRVRRSVWYRCSASRAVSVDVEREACTAVAERIGIERGQVSITRTVGGQVAGDVSTAGGCIPQVGIDTVVDIALELSASLVNIGEDAGVLAFAAGAVKRNKHNRRQNADDGDDDEEFDEGEAPADNFLHNMNANE